jgi:hypothetical protein
MNEWLEPLLAAAARAPSGDNTQPWRFVVGDETVGLELDPGRDPSPMNSGQRMARIAVGAALENLLRAARCLGLRAELAPDPGPFLALVRLAGFGNGAAQVDPLLGARMTNRRAYNGQPVAPEALARLARDTPDLEGVSTHWVVGAERLGALARVVGSADALMFGEPTMRRAFLANVRFDRPAAEAVDEGLSLASLELSGPDRLALRVMRRTPDPVLRLGGAPAMFNAKARQLVVSSSGLCLVSAPDGPAATDLNVGRAVQRAWLATTAEGLAAQPMMSLPVLDNALEHGGDRLREALGVGRVAALIDELRGLVAELGGGRLAWLMRFGFAPPPSGRTGRLPIEHLTTYTSPQPERIA